ncbi:MAG TPA: hypothetical protein VL048_18600 [Xanthobacteraceae bacterium]|jgi:hypothetical protein|nr:hypothetical protein [Xanthobacteraceae bacterium]
MIRTVFAMAVATLLMAAVSGTSQAAPIAPLPANVAAGDHGAVTHVWWYRHYRHCWRGRYGRLHCHW